MSAETHAAVLAHDLEHVEEVALRMVLDSFGVEDDSPEGDEAQVAAAVGAACQQLARAVRAGVLDQPALETLDRVPEQLGLVLSAIAPEPAAPVPSEGRQRPTDAHGPVGTEFVFRCKCGHRGAWWLHAAREIEERHRV